MVRPLVREIVRQLAGMAVQFPDSFVKQLELLRHNEADKKKGSERREEEMGGERIEIKIQSQRNEVLRAQTKPQCHKEFEVNHLQLLLYDMRAQKELLESEKRALEMEKSSARAEVVSLTKCINKLEDVLNDAVQSFEQSLTHERNGVKEALKAVSYTHLTLPTIYSV